MHERENHAGPVNGLPIKLGVSCSLWITSGQMNASTSQINSMSTSQLLRRFAIWSTAAFTSTLLIIFALNMYPAPDGDSIFFLPAIKAYASSGIVENKLVDLSFETDPKRLGRFLFYTPGFPVALGSAMAIFHLTSYKGALFLLSVIQTASIFFFAKTLIITLEKRSLQTSLPCILMASALVFSSGLYLFPTNGRPEILSMLIVSASLLASVSIGSRIIRNIVISIGIGLLFPVSIANGFIACSFYLFYLLADARRPATRIAFLALSLISGACLIFLSYSAGGLPFADGLRGLSLHSKMQLGRTDTGLGLILSYWKSWVVFAMLALAYLISSFLNKSSPRVKSYSSLDWLWLAFSFAILAFSIYFFGLRAAPIHYNLYAFLPLYQFLAFQLIADSHACRSGFFQYFLWMLLAIGFSLSISEPLRAAALFPYYLFSGSTYSEAKNTFSGIDIGDCALMYTGGLTVLDDPQIGSQLKVDESSRAVLSKRIEASGEKYKCVVAAIQEANSNSIAPVNMEKIADYGDISPWTAKLKALRLLNSPKGYSFKVYRQNLPFE